MKILQQITLSHFESKMRPFCRPIHRPVSFRSGNQNSEFKNSIVPRSCLASTIASPSLNEETPNASSLIDVSGSTGESTNESTNVEANSSLAEWEILQFDEEKPSWEEHWKKTLINQMTNGKTSANDLTNLNRVCTSKNPSSPETSKKSYDKKSRLQALDRKRHGRIGDRTIDDEDNEDDEDDEDDEDKQWLKYNQKKIELLGVEEGDEDAEGDIIDEFFEREAKLIEPYHSQFNNLDQQSDQLDLFAEIEDFFTMNASNQLLGLEDLLCSNDSGGKVYGDKAYGPSNQNELDADGDETISRNQPSHSILRSDRHLLARDRDNERNRDDERKRDDGRNRDDECDRDDRDDEEDEDGEDDEDKQLLKYFRKKIKLSKEIEEKLKAVEGDEYAENDILDEYLERSEMLEEPYHSEFNDYHQ